MKLFKTLFFPLFILVLVSCGDDDDTGATGDGLPGTWNMTSIEYTGSTITVFSGQTITTNFAGTGSNFDMQIVFNENPMTYMAEGSYDIELVSELNGQTTTTPITINDFIGNGTWSIVGNELIVETDTGETQTSTFELDGNTLTIFFIETISQSQSGVINTTTIDGSYTFERI